MFDLAPFFILDAIGPRHLRSQAQCPNFRGGLFGGQLLAHGLSAVASLYPDKPIHTLHTQFLAAGDMHNPIEYKVLCLRQGRSFSHFQIHARQKRRLIATMIAACHQAEAGFSHQHPAPSLVPPELGQRQALPAFELDNWLLGQDEDTPLEFVHAQGARLDQSIEEDGPSLCWLRLRAPLTAAEQIPALGFISDLGILASALIPHPTHLFHRNLSPASLNHTLWLHRPRVDLNQWHLLKITSPWAGHGRGLGQGYLFDAQGALVATATQEGLIRPLAPPAKPP